MADYLMLAEGGSMPESEEEKKRIMEAWGPWMASVGTALKDPGKPMSPRKSIAPDGSLSESSGSVNGYMILTADSLDDAVAMMKDCPVFLTDTSITVYETTEMV